IALRTGANAHTPSGVGPNVLGEGLPARPLRHFLERGRRWRTPFVQTNGTPDFAMLLLLPELASEINHPLWQNGDRNGLAGPRLLVDGIVCPHEGKNYHKGKKDSEYKKDRAYPHPGQDRQYENDDHENSVPKQGIDAAETAKKAQENG